MYKDEVIEIAKTAANMCDSIEVLGWCDTCPLRLLCEEHNRRWGEE